jgi:uncharacterized protein
MTNKLSYYTIFSNPIDDKNNRIVFSSRTSRSLKITNDCYEFIQNGLIDHIPEIIRIKLIELGILVDEEENELDMVIRENQEYIDENANKGFLYEVIQPTAFCQLGCYYCGQQHTKTNMSYDLIDKIVSRIVDKFNKGNYTEIYIGWFGGEPLVGLPQMRLINNKLKEIFSTKKIKIRGKVVTNGLSLKENIFLELVNDFNINQIEVTLDGTAEYHDQHRFTKSKGKSFDFIYDNLTRIMNLEKFQSYKCNFTIRCNVDEKNIDGVVPLIHKLAHDGLHKKIEYLYFASIYSWGGNDANEKAITKEEFSKLNLEWFILQAQLGYNISHNLPQRKKQTCIAVGGPSEMYDAYGNVFNCTEISYTNFYDNTPYQLGNLNENPLKKFENKPFQNWNQEILSGSQDPCHKCRLLPVCGGACPKSWKENNIPCPPFKYNIKKDLELRYIMKKTAPEELPNKLDEFLLTLDVNDFSRVY